MTNAPNSLEPIGPTMKMMPEGPRKICVFNGSRQIDQVIEGERTTLKALPESGLPKGIYQLGEATKASDGKGASFTRQVLFSDNKMVYQLSGRGMVEHSRSASTGLEVRDEEIVDGHSYIVAYVDGKGMASNAQAANVTQFRATSKGHGASM